MFCWIYADTLSVGASITDMDISFALVTRFLVTGIFRDLRCFFFLPNSFSNWEGLLTFPCS